MIPMKKWAWATFWISLLLLACGVTPGPVAHDAGAGGGGSGELVGGTYIPSPNGTLSTSGDVACTGTTQGGTCTVNAVSGTSPISITPSTLQWASGTVGPTLTQANLTTASGSGQNLTIQAQNETGTTSTGGSLILAGGTGTSNQGVIGFNTAGVSQMQLSSSSLIVAPPTLQWTSTTAAPTINQQNLTTASGTGQNLTIQAQNETGTTSTGGTLVLTSGTGTTAAGQVWLSTGGVIDVQITPTSISLAPSTLQWNAAAFPLITQVSVANVTQGQSITLQPQQSTQATNFGPGNVNVNFPTPGGTGGFGRFNVQKGGTSFFQTGSVDTTGTGFLLLGNGASMGTGTYTLASDAATNTFLVGPSILNLGTLAAGGNLITISGTAINEFLGAQILNTWQGTASGGQAETITTIPFVGQTTVAAAQTLYTYTGLTTGHSVQLEMHGVAANQGACEGAAQFQNVSGTVTQSGTTSSIYSINSVACSFTISGTTILVQGASGISATKNWQGWLVANLN